VAIESKLGKFQAADKGQMELYLRWLEKNEARPNEKSPLGLILCAEKSQEHIELLQLDKSGIRVAQYLTELPSRALLEKTLHDSIWRARERLAIANQQATEEQPSARLVSPARRAQRKKQSKE
jgi:YhcG PDDEXK nuclease domain